MLEGQCQSQNKGRLGLTDREVSMSRCLGECPDWAAVILWTPCWLRPVIKA